MASYPAETGIIMSRSFDQWLETGRSLSAQRRDVDWLLGDWISEGRESGFLDQASFDFLADNLGIAPKRLKDINRATEAFPRHLRDATLSIEHHASVASLPKQQALELLHEAKEQHWTPERTRFEAAHARTDNTDRPAQDTDGMIESFIRHWNRLTRPVRLEAAEMIAASHGEEIDL